MVTKINTSCSKKGLRKNTGEGNYGTMDNFFEEIKAGSIEVEREYFASKSGLPYGEEIVVKDPNEIICKVKIGSIENSWENLKVLSTNKFDSPKFGSPKFVPIKKFLKSVTSFLLKIRLSDGRQIICSQNHIFPKMVISISVKSYNSPESSFSIKYVNAKELKERDNLLVLHKIPFTSNVPKYIFIPKLLNWEHKWIGIKRSDYLKFSYRKNQRTNNPLIQLINSKFQYSRVGKKYRTLWSNLSNSEKHFLEMEAKKNHVEILIKIHENVGFWYSSIVPLTDDFFRYLGWYVAEGSTEKNRVTISQSKEKNYNNWIEIIDLLKRLGFPVSICGQDMIRINSNVLTELTIELCLKLAQNKKIPFELIMNNSRTRAFLETYYKGDGCQLRGELKKYTTTSQQLKNDLVSILGATGHFCSIWYPSSSDNCYRITETDGKHYRRKYLGLLKFNSTTPIRIKSIRKVKKNYDVFNLNTENGWFVSTNGILVQDS